MPTLYTVMSSGGNATNPAVYGEFSHSFVLGYKQVIEIVVNNMGRSRLIFLTSLMLTTADTGKHPFHLHGHHFQVLDRSVDNAGPYNATNATETNYPSTPIRRDTMVLYPAGYMVLRFVADNPGVWLFHCHIGMYHHVYQGAHQLLLARKLT